MAAPYRLRRNFSQFEPFFGKKPEKRLWPEWHMAQNRQKQAKEGGFQYPPDLIIDQTPQKGTFLGPPKIAILAQKRVFELKSAILRIL